MAEYVYVMKGLSKTVPGGKKVLDDIWLSFLPGAKIGVITTQGLRDVLEMRRRDRPRTWGLRGDFTPVVPRDLRLEVPERTLADGTILTPVDLDAVRAAGQALMDQGCLAVAVLFANAYANPENEAAAVAALRAIWPNPHVSASSEILPEIREYERFSTDRKSVV